MRVEGMSTRLHDALADLASETPTGAPTGAPEELWHRGVRRRRRVRAAVAAGVAAVLVGIAGVVTVATGTVLAEPPVAAPTGEPRMPDALWSPSPWIPGTDDAGPPGRIAVVFWDNMRRKDFWGRQSGGYVAVSAVDGRYRYLDVQGLERDVDPVLSPDGRYLAYPTYPTEAAAGEEGEVPPTGWAVYDAATGEVRRHAPAGVELSTAGEATPVWAGDSRTLLVEVCRAFPDDAAACRADRTDAWDVESGEVRELPARLVTSAVGTHGDGLLLLRGSRLVVLDATSGDERLVGRVDLGELTTVDLVQLDEESGELAVVGTRGSASEQLLAAGVPLDGAAPTWRRLLSGSLSYTTVEPLGWFRDGWALALVVTNGDEVGGEEIREQIRADEIRSERNATVIEVERGFTGSVPQLAADLADGPYRDGTPEPDDPTDPRLLVGGAVAVAVLAALAAGVWWRRRRLLG